MLTRLTLVTPLFLLIGCLSVKNDNKLYQLNMIADEGDYVTAYESARATAQANAKTHHRLLWRLHEGYLAYWAGKPKASIQAFTNGAEQLQSYEDRASLNARDLGSQLLSLMTEPGVKPYKGTVVDGILLHTYKGLAHALAGDRSSALAELRQGAFRRKQAHEHFRRQLDRAAQKNHGLPGGWRALLEVKEAIEAADGKDQLLPHYLEFTNPLQVHLEAIFATHQGSIQNREHARKLWSTLLAMNPKQTLVQTYRAWAEARHQNPNNDQPVIHLLHERGRAPELLSDAVSLAIPINGRLTGIHLAFPDLVTHEDHLPALESVASANITLEPIASLDSLIVAERKTKDSKRLIEQMGAALTKAIAENQLAKENDLLGLGLTLFNSSVNRADTRSWTTLPNQWEGALIESTTQLHRLTMGSETFWVEVPDPQVSWLLHLKSVEGKSLTHQWIRLDP